MLERLRSELKKNADKTYNFNQFFKTPIKAYGVRYPVLRQIAKAQFSADITESALKTLCDELMKSGVHEESVVAVMWAKQGNIAIVQLMKKWLGHYAKRAECIKKKCSISSFGIKIKWVA